MGLDSRTALRNLDPEGNDYITEIEFRKIKRSKNDVPEEDVEEMIEEYKAQKQQLDEIRPIIF